jgi:RNA polymerase sigma-70 factor (ECF subfamily)
VSAGQGGRAVPGEVFVEELYARHRAALMRQTMRLAGGDRHLAEDLAQEAIVRAWQHRDAITPGSERSWLVVTARHLAVDSYRRRQVRMAREARYSDLTLPRGGDDVAGRVADAVTVAAALAALPPSRRTVVEHLYFAGRSTGEAASALGIARGTVKSRSHYALAALRAEFGTGLGDGSGS